MELVEMVGWMALGFVPTLLSGNVVISRRRNGKSIIKLIATREKRRIYLDESYLIQVIPVRN